LETIVKLILASASPRRRELLARLTDAFVVEPPRVAEAQTGDPRSRAMATASAKARDVAGRSDGVVVAADTVVAIGEETLGKPASAAEAAEMLRRLSGREHRVITALCVLDTASGREVSAVEETFVKFRALDEEEIEEYVRSGEPLDKAGAYGIQGRAALFVEGIRGDFYNVVGLPLQRLGLLLREVGVRV
jgi:septum formation protein